ncbi:MAG TPA: biotin carboxylase N-terminal domain-containing protein [bacterium]|nr:biotin carboxylase N-terminal domain-containing protein [bacterium]
MTAPSPHSSAAGAAAPASDWRRSFRFDHVKVLVVCRGPIRLEAIEAFERLGTQPCGMLLSEKDSVVYPRALAPELRRVGRNERVHRIPDYAGTSAAEKAERIAQILDIAREGGYTHIFAGYGFMAEDHEFIAAIEGAGLGFVGPSTRTVGQAGAKDAAKALARSIGVSVTPGIDNIEALALLAQAGEREPGAFLADLAKQHELTLPAGPADELPEALAERVLQAGRAAKRELVTLAQLQAETGRRVRALLAEHPGRRLRFKHVGGGGGKGQRIVSAPEQVGAAVTEVLNEARATAPGDNRNFLIELNVESTRHNEIQLLGNGTWCIALGGRDCSLQMHEQKLLEVSISEELLDATAQAYERAGKAGQAAVLRADLAVLREMEAQAARFGEAVGLDSASTFESIVEGTRHYFMEVNTRIQVEHRVTEMVYALRFTNPEQPAQSFVVESLVEAMLWMAVHGPALPRPERMPRYGSGAETRINATNDALRPHAGGMVLDWSAPIADELRDDQGIGIRNPDTGAFMPYQLAGAYDSNIALIVTHGADREENFRRLAEILRLSDLRGTELMTNLGFHYGLLHWMLGADPMVKPSTRFVVAYLAGVGALKRAGADLDLELAWDLLAARAAHGGPAAAQAFEAKRTLILRPLSRLFQHPHLLAGWLAPRAERRFELREGRVAWRQNPLEVLEQLYGYLRLEDHPGVSPEERIWAHDQQLLATGLAFYRDLRAQLGPSAQDWAALTALLAADAPPAGMAAERWPAVQAAHRGHQAGLALLELPVLTGDEAGFYGIGVDVQLEVVMPPAFADEATAAPLRQALEVAPRASSNEVVAFTGGTFYARPSPDEPPYVTEGEHVEEGQVLGLLEVMKMFNPVRAAFAGTVREVRGRGETGQLVQKGQVLYVLEPDVPIVHETEAEREQRARARTEALLARL